MAVKREINGDTHWLNSRGKYDPVRFINKIPKRRDTMVERVFRKIDKLQTRMLADKGVINGWIKEFVEFTEQHHGAAMSEDANFDFTNYAGTMKIKVKISNVIKYDEQIHVAKSLIDKCFTKWGEGAHPNIRLIVNHAFKVDREGELNHQKMIELQSYEINNKDWKKAMEIITKSRRIDSRKRYITFQKKNGKGKWETINMNFSSM